MQWKLLIIIILCNVIYSYICVPDSPVLYQLHLYNYGNAHKHFNKITKKKSAVTASVYMKVNGATFVHPTLL